MVQYFPEITGSLTINGSLSVSGPMSITGSIAGTSSLASNALLLSGTGSVGFATTGSFTATSSSLSSRTTQIESVYATTGSNSFRATQSITGSLTVTGQITAQTLNVQQVTSSIVYSSGSNTFGCDLNSRQTFTGSVLMTGSLIVNTTGPELQVNNNGVILGNLLTDNHSITGSLRVTGSATFASTVTAGGNFSTMADGGAGGLRLTLNNTGAGEVQYVVLSGGSAGTGAFGIRNGSAGTNLFLMNGCGATTFASCISATSATFSSRLGVGISSDQSYASVFVGGDITTGVNQYAILADPQLSGTSNSYALFANARIKANTAVTNAFGVYIPSAEKMSGATITNNYALYIANQTSGATLNYSIYSSGGLNYFGGCVGINITNPTRMLQVKGNSEGQTAGISGATYGIRFDNGGTNSPNMSTIHGVDASLAGSYQPIMLNGLDVRFGTSDTERMRITSGGLVGIGTCNPTQALSVYRGGASNYLRIQGDNNSGYDIAQEFTDGTNAVYSGMMRGSTTLIGAYTIFTGGGARLNVTSGGNVAIGNGGPRQRLDTTGAIRASCGSVNGDAIAVAYGRTFYKVIISSNYDAGNNVRAAEWNLLTNNEGTGITIACQVYSYNGQAATFSISGGNIIVNSLSSGNNQIGVYTN